MQIVARNSKIRNGMEQGKADRSKALRNSIDDRLDILAKAIDQLPGTLRRYSA